MSVDIQEVITCATSLDDRLRGLGVARGRISRFHIDLRRRPYNTLALPCECVIGRILDPELSRSAARLIFTKLLLHILWRILMLLITG